MRRRRAPVDDAHPRRLLRFRADEWPDAVCHPECAYWSALRAWHEAHPGQTLDIERPGPRAPFHIEVI